MAELAPVILRWWFKRATPADSFLLGPSGYGYVYPGLMARKTQTAFAEATGAAAKALGMTGYVHWDWLGDFNIGIGASLASHYDQPLVCTPCALHCFAE